MKGFDGNKKVAVSVVGTIKWDFEDKNGTAHSFLIPGSLCIPSDPAKLFSPQHWAQEQKDHYPARDGTWCATFSDHVLLEWDWAQEQKDHYPARDGTWCATFSDHVLLEWGQRKFRRVVKYDQANIASFMSAPGSKKYRVCKAIFDATDEGIEETLLAFNATLLVTYDEEDWINEGDNEQSDDESHQSGIPNDVPTESETASSPVHFFQHRPDGEGAAENKRVAVTPDAGYSPTGTHKSSYELFEPCHLVENTDTEIMDGTLTPTVEMIQWHYRLGHLPFSKLRVMVQEGIIPRRLADCRVPKCSACIYGKMTRRAKKTKSKTNPITSRTITAPGQCVSVDQLESSTPGLIAQLKEKPTISRYRGATIYVNHFSCLSFVYLQSQLTLEESLKGKKAFEKYCEARGVTVKHCHADNGRFANNVFVNHVTTSRQSISYCCFGRNDSFAGSSVDESLD